MVTISAAPASISQQPPTPIPDCVSDIVDMTKLTQSDLLALSLRSSSAVDPHLPDELLFPKIDRSIFNESAGSRRQTYSRPPKPQSPATAATSSTTTGHHHRNRLPGLLPTPKPPPVSADDPERHENRMIISYLKHFISQNPNPNFGHIDLTPPSLPAPVGPARESMNWMSFAGERKRKRGRKPKVKVNVEGSEVELEIVNRDGAMVDIESLASADDPFGEELRKRTEGLATEEELLGFMRDLGGQWGSRRKRRKIVDACVLGDALPVGWKLLLGLKRKEGRASVYCRRYVSPSGEQFISCKEVSSYLRDHFGLKDACRPASQRTNDIQHDFKHASVTYKDDSQSPGIVSRMSKPIPSLSNEHGQEVNLLGIDNLAEVQIHDLFECHKCNMSFDEKDAYLQHLLSFHQRTTRRYRLGSSVGDGVIMKDGKYECQFCHKVFDERRRYNGHVGIHVRNYVKRVEEMPGQGDVHLQKNTESSSRDAPPLKISKMDALIEIAQSSILETSSVVDDRLPSDNCCRDGLNEEKVDAATETNAAPRVVFGPSVGEPRIKENSIEEAMEPESTDKDGRNMDAHKKEKFDDSGNVVDVKISSNFGTTIESLAIEENDTSETSGGNDDQAYAVQANSDKCGTLQEEGPESSLVILNDDNSIADCKNAESLACTSNLDPPKSDGKELESTLGSSKNEASDHVIKTMQQIFESTFDEDEAPDSVSKEESDPHAAEQRNDDFAAFEEIRYDEEEAMKYDFVTAEDPLTDVPVDMPNNADIEQQYVSPVRFGSEEVMLDVVARQQLTSACMWCGVEFKHDAIDSELPPDSVGFFCPTCKAKISGQPNPLDSDFASN
ncbi:hypothetical protein BT93_A2214 [Corymbia citriodora subsp. variegata]|nr:hypothetical protein BT93_A2214 [Corymbia citriodora subsp. variegata]KAF8044167.1 hypothetical protein BT93_A2214 [Corymbia citriodora subsp. variegata]